MQCHGKVGTVRGPYFLFVQTRVLLSYYSDLGLHGSADDKTRPCTIALAMYKFTTAAIFVVNVRDWPVSRYNTRNV